MLKLAIYLAIGCLFMLGQTVLLPQLLPLPLHLRADLMLLLIVYLCRCEGYLSGGALAWLLGSLLDVFAGNALGLHGVTFLVTFLAGRAAVATLNTESSVLLLFLVGCGTLLEAGLLLLLGSFAAVGSLWLVLLRGVFLQLSLNLVVAWLVLGLLLNLQRWLGPRFRIPGLYQVDRTYEA